MSNIFVDESGTMALGNTGEGQQGHYVIACVFTSADRANESCEAAANIVDKHARGGELKSSNIGGNSTRRSKILKDIKKVGLGLYALVVRKDLIYQDSGLQYKPVSYKFLHNMFYSHLESALDEIFVLGVCRTKQLFKKGAFEIDL